MAGNSLEIQLADAFELALADLDRNLADSARYASASGPDDKEGRRRDAEGQAKALLVRAPAHGLEVLLLRAKALASACSVQRR